MNTILSSVIIGGVYAWEKTHSPFIPRWDEGVLKSLNAAREIILNSFQWSEVFSAPTVGHEWWNQEMWGYQKAVFSVQPFWRQTFNWQTSWLSCECSKAFGMERLEFIPREQVEIKTELKSKWLLGQHLSVWHRRDSVNVCGTKGTLWIAVQQLAVGTQLRVNKQIVQTSGGRSSNFVDNISGVINLVKLWAAFCPFA